MENRISAALPAFAGRNPGIDLLRGVAIILVVIHHLALRIPLAKTGLADYVPLLVLKALSWDGGKAVKLFFVISGFLITDHTLRRWGSLGGMQARPFMARRFCRLMPCLLVLLALLSLFKLAGLPDFQFHHPEQSLSRAVFSVFFMHLNLYETVTGYLPPNWDVLWSLSVEEVFYTAFPLVCLVLARWPSVLGIVFACLAFALPYAEWLIRDAKDIWQDEAYGPGLCSIAMGVCAALVAHKFPFSARSRTAQCMGVLGSIGVGLYLLDGHSVSSVLGYYCAPLFYTLSCAALLLAFQAGWGCAAVMRLPAWPRRWGQMSYEIYLTHMFIVMPAVHGFKATGQNWQLGWLWFFPVLLGAYYLGLAVERFLSRPADRELQKVLRLRQAAPA